MPIIQLESVIISEGIGTTNKILPESQRMHVLNLVKDTEMECQSLDAEILRLQNKRARYASHMEKLHMVLAPSKHLPPEILAKIFTPCLEWHDSMSRSLKIPVENVNSTWQGQQRPDPLPALPWILGHICSRWRRIALGEQCLWNSISFTREGQHHLEMLEKAFKRGGQSALQLEATEFPVIREIRPFLGDVVRPQSHQISSLSLHIFPATYRDFLLLPSGLFNELVLTMYIVYVFSLSISYLDSCLAYGTQPLATTYVCYSVHWSSLFLL